MLYSTTFTMDQTTGDIKVIIVGASGIGRIHVREFARAGAKVLGIVGRNRDRAQQTVARLNREFDLDLIDQSVVRHAKPTKHPGCPPSRDSRGSSRASSVAVRKTKDPADSPA